MSKELTDNQMIAKMLAKMPEKQIEDWLNNVDNLERVLYDPPTEQEVCEALGEWLNVKEKIRYKDNQFQYKLCNYNGKNCIWTPINITLYGKGKMPPHLITMIGRFYEGKVRYE